MPMPLQAHDQRGSMNALGPALLFAATELILFAPFVVTLHIYFSEASLWQLILELLFVFIVGSLLGRIRWLSRTFYELAGCALAGYAAAVLVQGNTWRSWVCAAIGMLLAYRGIRCTKDSWPSLYPPAVFIMAGIVYFIGVPVMGHQTPYQPYMGWLNGLGFLALIFFLFATQRTQLLTATLAAGEQAASASLSESVKRSNRIWLTALTILIFIAAYFQQLKHGLVAAMRGAIAWLLSLLQSDSPPEPAPTAPPPLLPPADAGEPGWLDTLLHYIQVIVGYLVVIALILFALYVILTKLAPALTAFIRKLLNRSPGSRQITESSGFIDEKETLVDWKELPRLWWRQMRKGRNTERSHVQKWSLLPNNRERIRFLYRLLIERAALGGYRYNHALTPNETEKDLNQGRQLPPETVHAVTTAYNQVRYGEKEISEAQLEQVLQSIEPSLRNRLK